MSILGSYSPEMAIWRITSIRIAALVTIDADAVPENSPVPIVTPREAVAPVATPLTAPDAPTILPDAVVVGVAVACTDRMDVTVLLAESWVSAVPVGAPSPIMVPAAVVVACDDPFANVLVTSPDAVKLTDAVAATVWMDVTVLLAESCVSAVPVTAPSPTMLPDAVMDAVAVPDTALVTSPDAVDVADAVPVTPCSAMP